MKQLVFLCFLIVCPSLVMANTLPCFPFIGEKMKFSVGWEFVHAGTAEINISGHGKNGYKVHNFARTNSFFDMFKKVRDTLTSEGLCVGQNMQSTLFTTDQMEKTYKAKKEVQFLYKQNKVQYTKNGKIKLYDVPAGYLNVLDAFYLTRISPPSQDKPLSIPIFDSAEKYHVVVKLLKKDKLIAPWGKQVDCLVVQPELQTEGVFTSVGTIKIWLTDDARRIPLKITAKIKIGRIVVKMTSYEKTI